MSNPGSVRDALAASIAQHGGQVPGPNGGAGKPMPPQGGGQAPQGQGNPGGLAELAQAYARCEQTKNCTPQDLEILKAGLPQLVQMAQNIQKIIEVTSQGGGAGQPGNPQPAGSSPAPGAAGA